VNANSTEMSELALIFQVDDDETRIHAGSHGFLLFDTCPVILVTDSRFTIH
jgi:hypothetical protein